MLLEQVQQRRRRAGAVEQKQNGLVRGGPQNRRGRVDLSLQVPGPSVEPDLADERERGQQPGEVERAVRGLGRRDAGVNADAPRQRVGSGRTRSSARILSLDRGRVAALRAHRAAQGAERLLLGPGYNQLDLVFCREDGSPVAPEQVNPRFLLLSRGAGSRESGSTGYATHAPAVGVDVTIVLKRLGHA